MSLAATDTARLPPLAPLARLAPLAPLAPPTHRPRLFRTSKRDGWLVAAAGVQGALMGLLYAGFRARGLWWGSFVAVALSVWWSSNTVSHVHLHSPLFRSRGLNRAFSLYLTVLAGIPQTIWRARHLWHHAGEPSHLKKPMARGGLVELGLIVALFLALALGRPSFFFAAWFPGYLIGLLLCQAQGTYEHAGAGPMGISFYGSLYNRLWFNDGYHTAHHRHPDEHWTRLPSRRKDGDPESALPPLLRFFPRIAAFTTVSRSFSRKFSQTQALFLAALERLALASPRLQRFMIQTHARAFAKLLPLAAERGRLSRICVVGGGLFPRTALVLRALLPDAHITLLDHDEKNLECARVLLATRGLLEMIDITVGEFDPAQMGAFDLVVLPLALVGDGKAARLCARAPGAPALFVHGWLWRPHGRAGAVISYLLLKRLDLI